ncbi:MAG TPA: flagellar motor switch protein FliM [Kineosporiaceae bacterium]
MAYSNQATADRRRRRGEARTYDFRRPVRLAREHAHILRVAMQTFARQSSTLLTTSLRVVCQVNSAQLEELSYDEYLSGVHESSVCAVITLEPWPGRALLTFDTVTLLTIIDHQLGGPGGPDQPDRPLTDIEQALARQVLMRMLRELSYAVEPIGKTTPALQALESNAGFVQAAAPTDPVVVARLELSIGSHTAEASVCMPFAMLSPGLAALSSSSDTAEKALARKVAGERTQRRLVDVEVPVAIRFDPVRMPSSVIGRLEVGDVIQLNHRTSKPLSVTSASTTFARAIPGASGKTLAVLIVDPT